MHAFFALRTSRNTGTLLLIVFGQSDDFDDDYEIELWGRYPVRVIHETDPETKVSTREDIFQFFWTLCLRK